MKKYKKITILFASLLLAASCSPRIHALGSEGRVIYSDQGRLFIVFPEVMDKGQPMGQWFQYDGAVPGDTSGYNVNMVITKHNLK